MDWSLRQLEFFVTSAETGSFTEAASRLYVSQAAISRTVATLERAMGERLLRRVPRGCEPTRAGAQLLQQAKRVLAEADRFTDFARSRHRILRLGYAWAALGRHTSTLQRSWARSQPEIELDVIRQNSRLAGLGEGACDVAIVRRPFTDPRFSSVVVGMERRFATFSADDPQWARRRKLSMSEIAERTVLIDPRVGTTTTELWTGEVRPPAFVESSDVDSWLDAITAGRGVGTTSEATAHHHPRPGIRYCQVKDGPRIAVSLVWWRDDRPTGLEALVDTVTRLYASG